MNNKDCIIFTGGAFDFRECATKYKNNNLTVICADKGYDYAIECGFTPDILIGDLDSVADNSYHCEVIKYPKEKDDTDTMLAVKLALKKRFENIIILGAFGGRFDHMYANIQSLAYIYEHNATGVLMSDNEQVSMLIDGTVQICKNDKTSLSLFSYSEKCEGVTLKGVFYPLDNYEFRQYFPIGISNEITEKLATVSVLKGKMLIIQSKI